MIMSELGRFNSAPLHCAQKIFWAHCSCKREAPRDKPGASVLVGRARTGCWSLAEQVLFGR
jgi:hypothetical protein